MGIAEKIEEKSVIIGVIGLGYVGLPLAVSFLRAGVRVLGFDIDKEKVEKIESGESYLTTVSSKDISHHVKKDIFSATADFSRLNEPDAVLISVPTPLGEGREPDLSFVVDTTKEVSRKLRRQQLIVLESTTYPGTTEEVILPILEESGMKVGKDFYLGYSPEREDPGNKRYPIWRIPKVVSGITPSCLRQVERLYSLAFDQVFPVSSTRAAEMTKLLENIYRSVNIALVNELKMLAVRMGLNIWEVIEAAATKPFGFQPFYPGPGLGGHCIPIDPFYLAWKSREYDFPTRFIELSGEINTAMPYFVVSRMIDALNDRGKSLKGASILVLGVAYKRDVGDVRESPAVKIINLLMKGGAEVAYHDPFVPKIPSMRKAKLVLESAPLTAEALSSVDCVLIVTDHSGIDYQFVVDNASLVVDTRNATRNARGKEGKVVIA
jgi:UDP-N-acetyl-D-glucosamine dehydrogenase